jgi:hypothetical protein
MDERTDAGALAAPTARRGDVVSAVVFEDVGTCRLTPRVGPGRSASMLAAWSCSGGLDDRSHPAAPRPAPARSPAGRAYARVRVAEGARND